MTKTATPDVTPEVTAPVLGYFRRGSGVFFRTAHPARPGVFFEKRVDGKDGALPAGVNPKAIPYE